MCIKKIKNKIADLFYPIDWNKQNFHLFTGRIPADADLSGWQESVIKIFISIKNLYF